MLLAKIDGKVEAITEREVEELRSLGCNVTIFSKEEVEEFKFLWKGVM